MNRRPRWSDLPGILIDLTMAAALFACIVGAAWWLVQLTDN